MADDEPTPEEDQVRSLLSALPSEAMPDDVADRLDAALRAEAASRHEATATPLHRVRRWLPSVAVAAVVLGIVAIAVPQVLQDSESGHDSTVSAESPSEPAAGSSEGESTAPRAERTTRPGDGAQPSPDSADGAGPVTIGADTFVQDVASLVVRRGLSPAPGPAPDLGLLRCREGLLVTSSGLVIRLDGDPARLFAAGPAQARMFRAIGCVGGEPRELAAATLDTTPR